MGQPWESHAPSLWTIPWMSDITSARTQRRKRCEVKIWAKTDMQGASTARICRKGKGAVKSNGENYVCFMVQKGRKALKGKKMIMDFKLS